QEGVDLIPRPCRLLGNSHPSHRRERMDPLESPHEAPPSWMSHPVRGVRRETTARVSWRPNEPHATCGVSPQQHRDQAAANASIGQTHYSPRRMAMTDVLRSGTMRLMMGALAARALFTTTTVFAADQMTQPFTGKAVNGGTMTATQQGGK